MKLNYDLSNSFIDDNTIYNNLNVKIMQIEVYFSNPMSDNYKNLFKLKYNTKEKLSNLINVQSILECSKIYN